MKPCDEYGPSLHGTLRRKRYFNWYTYRYETATVIELGRAFSRSITPSIVDQPGYTRPPSKRQPTAHQNALTMRVRDYVLRNPGCTTAQIAAALESRFDAVMKVYYDHPNDFRLETHHMFSKGQMRKSRIWEVLE